MPLVIARVYLALGGEDLAPFTFQVANVNRLVFKVDAFTAKSDWWSAGWVNAYLIDANQPTFATLEKWARLPLGASFFDLPTTGIYQIKIDPHDYLKDFRFLAWS